MYIKINKIELFFDVYGSKLKIEKDKVVEKPTLIVLHGGHGFADHTLYVEFWSQFANLAQIIFIDQRGCGRSEHGKAEDWNLRQWSNDLYQFCQELKIQKPIIAGVSMGGHVMCDFISQYSDFPAGLIFCNTEARFPLDIVCQKLNKLGGKQAEEACRNFFENPTEATLQQYTKICIPYYAKNAYSTIELNRCIKNQAVFLHYCQQQMLRFNYVNELNKIVCPTLLMVGENSLHVVESAEEMQSAINPSYVSLRLFQGAGAPVYKDKPEEAYQTVEAFLQRFI